MGLLARRGAAPIAAPSRGSPLEQFGLSGVKTESAPLVEPYDAVQFTEDLARIEALPRRAPEPVAFDAHRLKRMNERCACAAMGRKCITELLPIQAWALNEGSVGQGVLGPIGVGHGKELLGLLMPMVVPNCKVAVLFIKPSGRKQLLEQDIPLYGQHWNLPNLAGGRYFTGGRPVLHVMAYSELSHAKSTAALERIRPDLIIANECQEIARDSVRTGRVRRYFDKYPNTRACAWSGSLSKRSLKDYWHLSAWSLKLGSPLPLSKTVVEEWAAAIDSVGRTALWAKPMGALSRLCEPGENARQGFQRRLRETPGVVSTTESAIPTSLVITQRDPGPQPKAVHDALRKLRGPNGVSMLNRKGELEEPDQGDWCRPDGEVLVEVAAVAECARQLASGFYYQRTFPRKEPPKLIDEWLKRRSEWHSEVRGKIRRREVHLDSLALCQHAADRYLADYKGPLPVWQSDTWEAWKEIADQVEPSKKAVWISDWLLEDAAGWLAKHRGICWVDFVSFGERLAQVTRADYWTGGDEASDRVNAAVRTRCKKSVIASIAARGTGTDGAQFLWADQLVAHPPASGDLWEQLLGRLHRIGQEADEVTTEVYLHSAEFMQGFKRAIEDCRYRHETLGNVQKLGYCTLNLSV